MSINVAIDGPAGAGKSTIAKAAAKLLGFIYVDTGALYRTIGVCALRNNVEPSNSEEVIKLLPNTDVSLRFIDGVQRVFLNGEDVSEEIRLPEASMAASNVSAIPEVRKFLFDLQKNIAEKNNVIMDGRDIGTVVLPDAKVKIFLTASSKVRADRRFKEFEEKGIKVEFIKLLAEIEQRDFQDMNREIAPLKQADDAILVDTSELSLEQSVDKIVSVIKEKI